MGNRKENIQKMQFLIKPRDEQIKNGPNNLSKMRQVMKRVKYFGIEENVWQPGSWNREVITKLWSTVWHRFYPCLHYYFLLYEGKDITYAKLLTTAL